MEYIESDGGVRLPKPNGEVRLRIKNYPDQGGTTFGVPEVTIAQTGERVPGVQAVVYDAADGEFPTVTITFTAAIHDIDVLAYLAPQEDEGNDESEE